MSDEEVMQQIYAKAIRGVVQKELETRRRTSHSNDPDVFRYSGFVLMDVVACLLEVVFHDTELSAVDDDHVSIDVDYSNEHGGMHVGIEYADRADVTAKAVADALARYCGVKVTCEIRELAGKCTSG